MPKYTTFIKNILSEASKTARRNFGRVHGTVKGSDPNQVLTAADLAIGRFLVDQIARTFPAHNILDEEAGVVDKGSVVTWVVDPIDGTSNFAAGVPMYGIMVGLLEREIPVAGGIALPFFSDICVAEKGFGVANSGELLKINDQTHLGSSLVAYGMDGHPETPEVTVSECRLLGEIALKVRNLRSSNSVFDAMMVVKGGYGAFLNRTSKIWDNVAQQIIIEEAGGIYTDFWGKPMDYSDCLHRIESNYTFCAAAPLVHRALQNIIHNSHL